MASNGIPIFGPQTHSSSPFDLIAKFAEELGLPPSVTSQLAVQGIGGGRAPTKAGSDVTDRPSTPTRQPTKPPGQVRKLVDAVPAGLPMMPLPPQVGRGWMAALPQLGAALGNSFAAYATAKQNREQLTHEREVEAQKLEMQKAESQASIAASEAARKNAIAQRIRLETDSMDADKALFELQDTETQIKLRQAGATPEKLDELRAAGDEASMKKYGQLRSMYVGAATRQVEQATDGIMKNPEFMKLLDEVGIDTSNREAVMTYVRSQTEMGKAFASYAELERLRLAKEEIAAATARAKTDRSQSTIMYIREANNIAGDMAKIKEESKQQETFQAIWDTAYSKDTNPKDAKELQNKLTMLGVLVRPDLTPYQERLKPLEEARQLALQGLNEINPALAKPYLSSATPTSKPAMAYEEASAFLEQVIGIKKASGEKLNVPPDSAGYRGPNYGMEGLMGAGRSLLELGKQADTALGGPVDQTVEMINDAYKALVRDPGTKMVVESPAWDNDPAFLEMVARIKAGTPPFAPGMSDDDAKRAARVILAQSRIPQGR